VRATVTQTYGQVIAIDGKPARRSHDRGAGKAAIHLVSAWAARTVSSWDRKTDAKSNEITAIPALLDLLLLKGCIVTIDAMGCQTAIARQIVAQGGTTCLPSTKTRPRGCDELGAGAVKWRHGKNTETLPQ